MIRFALPTHVPKHAEFFENIFRLAPLLQLPEKPIKQEGYVLQGVGNGIIQRHVVFLCGNAAHTRPQVGLPQALNA
ncbi:hypothetical protein D3C80_2169840 [compost metagenome]